MDELVDRFGYVSVADLKDLLGRPGNYTDNKYGWHNIASAAPYRTRDGRWGIKLPKATII